MCEFWELSPLYQVCRVECWLTTEQEWKIPVADELGTNTQHAQVPFRIVVSLRDVSQMAHIVHALQTRTKWSHEAKDKIGMLNTYELTSKVPVTKFRAQFEIWVKKVHGQQTTSVLSAAWLSLPAFNVFTFNLLPYSYILIYIVGDFKVTFNLYPLSINEINYVQQILL